jgi:hypothetical protein
MVVSIGVTSLEVDDGEGTEERHGCSVDSGGLNSLSALGHLNKSNNYTEIKNIK